RVEAQSLLERLDPPFEACVRALEAEDNPLEFGAALAARFLAPATSLHAGRIGTRSRPALQEFPKTSTASTRPRHPARPAPAWRSSAPSAGPLNGYLSSSSHNRNTPLSKRYHFLSNATLKTF